MAYFTGDSLAADIYRTKRAYATSQMCENTIGCGTKHVAPLLIAVE